MTIKESWNGRIYEEFQVGDVFRHALGRTVTQTDNIWFTLLTVNPLRSKLRAVEVTRWLELFIKNTALCKIER